MNDGTEMITNEVLWAIGRGPEIRELGIDKTGIKRNEQGHIIVDKYQNTNVEGIYAIGDITGQAELTPVAIAAGRRLGNRLFGPPELKEDHIDYDYIPTVVFSHPTCGQVGLTEPQAEEKYGKENLKVYTTKFSAMFYDVFPPEMKKKYPTQYKVICHGKDEVIVGMHILGDGSDEAMQGWGVVVRNVSFAPSTPPSGALPIYLAYEEFFANSDVQGLTKKALDDTIPIHPTSTEELVTLR